MQHSMGNIRNYNSPEIWEIPAYAAYSHNVLNHGVKQPFTHLNRFNTLSVERIDPR